MTIMKTTVRKDIPFALVASALLLIMCLDGDISRLDAGILFVMFLIFMYMTLKGAKKQGADAEEATAVATNLGVSEAVIGLTIVAGGTSLPELATSVVSARKGNSGIAIGNALGSNVFNILAILGITGMITPMTLKGITYIDLSMLVISIMLVWLFSFTKYKIERWEGAVLTAVFVGYIYSLL